MAAAPPPMDPLQHRATAIVLRDLRERGVLTAEQAVAMERQLRAELPWRVWTERVLLAIGGGLLVSGVVFFFAFNWARLAPWQKFTVVEVALLLAAAWAAWKGLGTFAGQIGLMMSCVLVGVFLAVFGQIYQTGADAYELFLGWALLILPWVLLSRFGALWLFWLLLCNLALGLAWGQTGLAQRYHLREFWNLTLLLGILNGMALAGGEIAAHRGVSWLREPWLRAVPLVGTYGVLTTGLCALIVMNWFLDSASGTALVACWLLVVAAGYAVYRWLWPSLFALSVIALSVCTVITMTIWNLMWKATDDGFAAFFLMGVIVLAVFGGAVLYLRAVGRSLEARAT